MADKIEKIVIAGKDFTVDEARGLYEELKRLFGDTDRPVYIPYPVNPRPIIPWWQPDIVWTCTTGEEVK